jgi:hypothetical protein
VGSITNCRDVEGLEPASEKQVLTSNWGVPLSQVDKKFKFSSHMADAGAQKQIEMGLSCCYVLEPFGRLACQAVMHNMKTIARAT